MADRTIKAIITASASGLISELNRASAATQKFGKDLGGSISKNQQTISSLANAAGGLGLALAAGVGLAVKTAADFDQAMSNVSATGKDARDNIDALRQAAIDMGASTSFSAGEAAAGIENLLKAGVDAKDVLGGGLKGALDLAAAGQIGVGDAAEIAATAMTQFNLSGAQVPHIADLLAAGAGKAQGEVSDMGMALKQSGLVANQFGLSIEDTTGTLAAFASAGLLGSDAGTSFKTMLTQLANPSKESAALMKELGINAYDAQGQFVGITNLAGQLDEKLGDLAPATRDQALAQIFGNDALRAANVLMDQGSGGIQKWINNVNDQGYAAETAATKLDNLKGDLEELKGAFETALIGLGESGQGPLRELVQGVTDAINAFNSLDEGTKGTVLRVVATVAGLLIAAGTIGKLVVAGNEAITAFKGIASAAPGATRAIGNVGRIAAGAGVGIGAFVLAVKLAGDQLYNGPMVKGTEQVEAALLKLQTTGDKTDLDRMFQVDADGIFNRTGKIIDGVDGLDDAITRFTQKDGGQQFNDFMSEALAFTGVPSAYGDLKKQITEIDGAFAKMVTAGNGAKAAEALAKSIDLTKYSADQLFTAFPEYKAALVAQANALGVVIESDKEYADWMGGKIPPAIQAAIDKQKSQTGASKTQAGAMGDVSIAALDLETAQKSLGDQTGTLRDETKKMIRELGSFKDLAMGAERSSITFEAALDDLAGITKEATKAGDKHAKSLDADTESGRKNRSAILDAIDALNVKSRSVFEDTLKTKGLDAATKAAAKVIRDGTKDIKKSGDAAGLAAGEVDDMTGSMVKTPKELATDIETPGMKAAQTAIKKLEDRIKDLESKTVKITTDFKVTGTTLDFKTGKAVKVGNKVVSGDWHTGGYTGAGGKYEPAGTVHKGEVVFEQEAVAAAGGAQRLDQFRMDLTSGNAGLYGYASGGIAGLRPRTLAGRPRSLSGRPRGLGGRPDEIEELNIHGNLSGSKINPKPLFDEYSSQLSKMGGALANQIAKEYVKKAETLLQGDGGVNGNFSVIDVNNPRGLTNYRGGTFTNLFAANLRRAEQAAGATIRVFQGGWRPRTSYSGTSHQGDAIDLQVNYALIRALRNVGIAAWDRTGKGNWAPHVHGVPSPKSGYAGGSAIWQWQDYTRGGDGLGSGGLVRGWSPNSKADNIHTWATAGEFMQPVDAVAYYGREFMEAVRTKQFPRQVISHRFAPNLATSVSGSWSASQGSGGPTVIVEQKGNYGWDPDRIAREEAKRFQDAMIMVGMTAAMP